MNRAVARWCLIFDNESLWDVFYDLRVGAGGTYQGVWPGALYVLPLAWLLEIPNHFSETI